MKSSRTSNYLKDRRVTTVEEQQTWEDMEDEEYDLNNHSNLVSSLKF
jgi:hypothetical protein